MATSTARQQRAEHTRHAIRDAARDLFLSRGYTGTTIPDIARAAGVAHQTVYFTYGSKAGVLSAIVDAEIVGDLEPVPLLQRAPVRRLGRLADPVQRLQRTVAVMCQVTERVAPLYEIARSGATDDEVRALLDRHEEQRWETHRALVALLADDLRPGLGVDEAADRLYALVSHEIFWLLVRRRGWTSTRWRRYAQEEAVAQLLPSPGTCTSTPAPGSDRPRRVGHPGPL
jgi:AcrR family transcriptional regulator